MAAGRLSAPGSKLGPCAEPCAHIDCRESRAMAAALCVYCGEPIGFLGENSRAGNFFQEPEGDYSHESCAFDAAEAQ